MYILYDTKAAVSRGYSAEAAAREIGLLFKPGELFVS
jgi:hypothetical protein